MQRAPLAADAEAARGEVAGSSVKSAAPWGYVGGSVSDRLKTLMRSSLR